jgi:hypothetical protein
MCAVVVISLMFGAVIVMVKRVDNEARAARFSRRSIPVRRKPNLLDGFRNAPKGKPAWQGCTKVFLFGTSRAENT